MKMLCTCLKCGHKWNEEQESFDPEKSFCWMCGSKDYKTLEVKITKVSEAS